MRRRICIWICALNNYVSYTLVCVHFIVYSIYVCSCSTPSLYNPSFSSPLFSSPANSTPVISSIIFQSYKFSYPVCPSVCLPVRPSDTSRSCTKMAIFRITLRTAYDSPGTLVFRCQKSWRTSNDITPKGGAK